MQRRSAAECALKNASADKTADLSNDRYFRCRRYRLTSATAERGKPVRQANAGAHGARPEEGKDQSRPPQALERQRGPRIWVDATDQWASGSAVSKRNEFPDYYAPLPQTSLIRERRGKPKTTVGSALAIAPNGVWLTARHVVEGCQDVIVQGGLKNGRPANLRTPK